MRFPFSLLLIVLPFGVGVQELGSVGDAQPPLVQKTLRLYSMRFCPFAHRVNLVLQAKNIRHDVVNIDLLHKPEWIFEKSGGTVPVIEFENGETLCESVVIAEYLDEAYPGRKLLAPTPLQRARDRIMWQKFSEGNGPFFKIIMEKELKEENVETIKKVMDEFEKELKKRKTKFFGGDMPGMLDYLLWPTFERAELTTLAGANSSHIPICRYANMLRWRKEMLEDEAVKFLHISSENHIKFFTSGMTGTPTSDILVTNKY